MDKLKVLVGICGIGYGHTIRQSLVIENLRQRGAQVAIFSFNKSFEYLKRQKSVAMPFWEVHVPWIYTDSQGINWEKTEKKEVHYLRARNQLKQAAFDSAKKFFNGLPDICISDYEPVSASFAYENEIPLITVDQQSKFLGYQTEDLNVYSREEERARLSYFFPYAAARFACSFYTIKADPDPGYPVELIPAPVRQEIANLQSKSYSLHQDHTDGNLVVVYFSPYGPITQELSEIVELLSRFRDCRFHVYADPVHGSIKQDLIPAHVQLKSFDRRAFAHDLASASALISTAGHTLLSEAIYLKIPIYALPLSTYDQHYCGHMIEKHEIGISCDELSEDKLRQFLSDLSVYRKNLTADPDLMVSDTISTKLFDSITQLAQTYSRVRKSRGAAVLPPSATNDQTVNSRDRLYLPDLDEILANPSPRHCLKYTTAVIKPTMCCTYDCIACESRAKDWWRPDAQGISIDQWKDVIKQIKAAGFQLVTISGGEPLIYPDLVELVHSISSQGLLPVINTNGVHLPPKLLQRLCDAGLKGINFSLDSPRPSIHDAMRRRRGAWRHCLEAVRNAREYDDRIWFAIRMVLTAQNLMDLPEMIRLAAEQQASSLKLSYLEWSYLGSSLLPTLDSLRRFKALVLPCCEDVFRSLEIPEKQKETSISILRNLLYSERINSLENYSRGIYWADKSLSRHCKVPYSLAIIGGDGNVLPCNAAEYARLALPDNLLEKPLEVILGSPAMQHFRENPPDICLYCPMPLHLTLPLQDNII
jgi:uncharacterized protein (TIGR00661 family)